MQGRLRVIVLGATSAALAAGSSWGAAAFGAPAHTPKNAVVFRAEHIPGVRGLVLVEGKDLVVYTFSGDTRGHRGTCTGGCASVWPPVRGIPVLAHGVTINGRFGRIDGQVTFNGWPLYLFTGEKPKSDHADASFKVVRVTTRKTKPSPGPSPTPTPSPMPSGSYPPGW